MWGNDGLCGTLSQAQWENNDSSSSDLSRYVTIHLSMSASPCCRGESSHVIPHFSFEVMLSFAIAKPYSFLLQVCCFSPISSNFLNLSQRFLVDDKVSHNHFFGVVCFRNDRVVVLLRHTVFATSFHEICEQVRSHTIHSIPLIHTSVHLVVSIMCHSVRLGYGRRLQTWRPLSLVKQSSPRSRIHSTTIFCIWDREKDDNDIRR